MSNVNKILDICIMKMKMDSLHYALLAIIVLLAVYCATRFFREGADVAYVQALDRADVRTEIQAKIAKSG